MMKKNLFMCFAMLMSFVGCVRTIELHVDEPTMTVKELRNCILEIQNCPKFIEDSATMYMALTSACDAAGFGYYRIHTESIDQDVWVMYAYAEKGYAALWIHKRNHSCTIEFCSINGLYDYASFLDTFLTEFHTIERNDEWEKTFTDLLE